MSKYSVIFVDGVGVHVWACNEYHARTIATLRRQADQPGTYYISCVTQI